MHARYRRALHCAAIGAAWIASGCDSANGVGSDLTPLPPELPLEVSGVRIDGYEEDLVPIGPTAMRSDGVIAFAQGQDGRVLFYDSEGRRVGDFGSSGQGPGEFSFISRLGWSGERLWVDDFRQRRLTWIDVEDAPTLDGDLAYRSLGPTAATDQLPSFARMTPVGAYGDGSFLMQMAGARDSTDTFDGHAVLARVDTTGAVLRSVATYPRNSGMVSLSQSEGGNIVRSIGASAPWTLRTVEDLGRLDGAGIFAITRVLSSTAAEVRVVALGGEHGDTVHDTELTLEATSIPERARDSAVEARVERLSEGIADSWPDFADVYRREVAVPAIFPLVSGITLGADGRAWLQLWSRDPDADSVRYLVLDGDGRPEFRTSIPRGRVTAAGERHAWIHETDSLGVGSLLRYDIRERR